MKEVSAVPFEVKGNPLLSLGKVDIGLLYRLEELCHIYMGPLVLHHLLRSSAASVGGVERCNLVDFHHRHH